MFNCMGNLLSFPIKKVRIQLHSYIRTKQITNSTYMKKQILLLAIIDWL